jgi:hypothetical protein
VTKHNVLYNDYLTENDNKDYVIWINLLLYLLL